MSTYINELNYIKPRTRESLLWIMFLISVSGPPVIFFGGYPYNNYTASGVDPTSFAMIS